MKRYYPTTFVSLAAVLIMFSFVPVISAADDSSADLDAFAASYRKEKKAQHKEKILKVLRPAEKKEDQRSQEFIVRSLYDQAVLAYRQENYNASQQTLTRLQDQLAQSALTAPVRMKWSKKADALYKNITAQEEKQRKAFERQQAVKMKVKKVVAKPAAVKKVVPPPVAAIVPSPDTARQENALNLMKQRKQDLQVKRDEIQKEFNQRLEKMYAHAIELYKAKDYALATVVFQDIQQLSANYKDTNSYLKRLERLSVK